MRRGCRLSLLLFSLRPHSGSPPPHARSTGALDPARGPCGRAAGAQSPGGGQRGATSDRFERARGCAFVLGRAEAISVSRGPTRARPSSFSGRVGETMIVGLLLFSGSGAVLVVVGTSGGGRAAAAAAARAERRQAPDTPPSTARRQSTSPRPTPTSEIVRAWAERVYSLYLEGFGTSFSLEHLPFVMTTSLKLAAFSNIIHVANFRDL